MHFFTTCFVSGSVTAQVDGIEECAAGAEVVLKQDGAEVARATTDTFGEFKLDKLVPESGSYQLEISGQGGSLSRSVEVGSESLYLGVLELTA